MEPLFVLIVVEEQLIILARFCLPILSGLQEASLTRQRNKKENAAHHLRLKGGGGGRK